MGHVGEIETITGEVISARILGENSWGKTEIRLADGSRAALVGPIIGYQFGDTIEARGFWHEHPRFGHQFKVRETEVTMPGSVRGVVAWLSSYVPHIGGKRAKDLVERFGVPGIWKVVEESPRTLLEVNGITEERLEAIVDAYAKHRAERDEMVKLRGWGLTDGQIGYIRDKWGSEAVERIEAHPYDLTDVHGMGFKRADAVARRMGIGLTDPGRLRAGTRHVLEETATSGHVYVQAGKLIAMSAKLLEVTDDDVRSVVFELANVVNRKNRIYLRGLYEAEHFGAVSLLRMLRASSTRARAAMADSGLGGERGAA